MWEVAGFLGGSGDIVSRIMEELGAASWGMLGASRNRSCRRPVGDGVLCTRLDLGAKGRRFFH